MPVHFAIENAAKEIARDALFLRPYFNEQLLYNLYPFLGQPLERPGIVKKSTSFSFTYNVRALDPEEIYKQIQDKVPGAINELLSILNDEYKSRRFEELRLYSIKPTVPYIPGSANFIFIAPKVAFEYFVYVKGDVIEVKLETSYYPG